MRMRKEKTNKFEYLTETPVPELILRLSVPTIISMLVTGIYNSADTFFVGRISENGTGATAAVGLVFPIMAVIQAVAFMFGHGSGNTLSRMLGAGKKKEASEMAATGFALAILTGIVFAVFGNIFTGPTIRFFASEEITTATFHMTEDYARIILLGAPFTMGQFVINNQLRFQGSAVYAMVGLLSGAVLNMFLDPVLILMCGMGVKGAAIATVVGQMVSFFVLLYGSRMGDNVRPHVKNIRINGYYVGQIINGGIPSLFRQGLAALATTLLNKAAGEYGALINEETATAAIAAMTICTRVMMLLASALIGFGQGYQPVCSFNYGAGKKNRVREGYLFCLRWGAVFLLVVSSLCYIYAPQVIRFFRKDADVVAVGKVALRYQAMALPLLAVTIMTNMMLQSIGKGVKASILASARSGIFFIPAILILPRIYGLTGVEIAQSVADVFAAALAVPLAVSELRKMKEERTV